MADYNKLLYLTLILCGCLGVVLYMEYASGVVHTATLATKSPSTASSVTHPRITVYEHEYAEFEFAPRQSSISYEIPLILWTYWDGPADPAIQHCMESWKRHNPEYQYIVLNRQNYHQYIDPSDPQVESLKHACRSPTRCVDSIRCMVMAKNGGVWVDASVLCSAPLTWVHDAQSATGAEFVGYYHHKGTYPEFQRTSPMVETWFFACVPESRFVNDWCNEFLRSNEFDTLSEYLADVRKQGVHLNNIHNLGETELLTVRVSCQKVLQAAQTTKAKAHPYTLCLFSACAGPLRYLYDADWDFGQASQALSSKQSSFPMTMFPPDGLRVLAQQIAAL